MSVNFKISTLSKTHTLNPQTLNQTTNKPTTLHYPPLRKPEGNLQKIRCKSKYNLQHKHEQADPKP